MSVESAVARVAELNSAFAPLQAPPASAGDRSSAFSGALREAMSPSGPSATAAGGAAAPARGSYPHLSGDLDASPELLRRLEALAARRGERFHVTSGLRTIAEQRRLWENRHNNPFPVAPPGRSNHHAGRAADVTIGGRPIQSVISAAELRAAGLVPLRGDAVHVELP